MSYVLEIVGYSLALAALGVVWFYLIRSVLRMSRRSAAVKKRASHVMAGRSPLTHAQFGAEYFPPDQAAMAARIREILADILIVDMDRIHPDDHLIEDLGLGQVDGLDPNILEFHLEREFRVSLRPGWLSIKTLRDLVTYISSRRPVAP